MCCWHHVFKKFEERSTIGKRNTYRERIRSNHSHFTLLFQFYTASRAIFSDRTTSTLTSKTTTSQRQTINRTNNVESKISYPVSCKKYTDLSTDWNFAQKKSFTISSAGCSGSADFFGDSLRFLSLSRPRSRLSLSLDLDRRREVERSLRRLSREVERRL